jgi:hypothetical protein
LNSLKKIGLALVLTIFLIFNTFTVAIASSKVTQTNEGRDIIVTETLSLATTSTLSAVPLDWKLAGSYLYQVELLTSLDDTVTFAITSSLGVTLFTTTTTAATSGAITMPVAFYAITPGDQATWTLTGLGSGTATIKVTVIKK